MWQDRFVTLEGKVVSTLSVFVFILSLPVVLVKKVLISTPCRSSIGPRRRLQNYYYLILILCIFVWVLYHYNFKEVIIQNSVVGQIEDTLEDQLKLDKGTGCEIPELDPFAPEVMQFDEDRPKVKCAGQDWVKCYLSECKVVKVVLKKFMSVSCTYKDILYVNDDYYYIGKPVVVSGADVYHLNASDHAKVSCVAIRNFPWLKHNLTISWRGLVAGFRSPVPRPPSPAGREHAPNILIFGYDSTARNGFIRRMPKSYKYLTEQLQAEVLNGYNIVGDGTPQALIPLLTGKIELELPDARRRINNNVSVSDMPFIFSKLREDGYRTLYFEDTPWAGTFQYRFNGFRHQPTDHYLRAFLLEDSSYRMPYIRWYCIGDTPQYKLMMNLTSQFFHLDGKKFAFTFIADITHADFNMISTADEDFVEFLESFKNDGFLKNTMLLVMGDHGPRHQNIRNTYQGRLEERLPLMAIVLPSTLKSQRPRALATLRQNVDVLTTPHDIHATILDAIDLRKYWNPYKIQGADLPRAMSLLEPIPRSRSCSEAGIEPHWCACLSWRNVSHTDPLYCRAADAFVFYINTLTETVRSKCVPRNLSSVTWVMKQHADSQMLSFERTMDADGRVPKFGEKVKLTRETYQVKLTVGPGVGDFEASMTYHVNEDKFYVDSRDISRTNKYGREPDCISKTHPYLNPFCYCAVTL